MKTVFKTQSIKNLLFITILSICLVGCNGKLPGGDARKFPADPELRVKQNLEEGRGFRLSEFGNNNSGTFEFASSNELWRASLDVVDFMPLLSVNYSGGIIITDWYSSEENSNEYIKISIRFLTNEVRSDALDIKIFNKKCNSNLISCKISQNESILNIELKKEILKKASVYKKENTEKNKKEYKTRRKTKNYYK
ncbi:DUF3576 domain-containing protein [Candidatus Pelagibacter sp. HIMB1715]|uniref:DUF3576 domain-containing protein n=1 Tax=Candidatus Pelagibacter sp. HIMB1715 TaxID=3413369 RepID=UPI003F82FF8E